MNTLPTDFIESSLEDGWIQLQHKSKPLKFLLRHNHNGDWMMEFRLFHGDDHIGAGVQYVLEPHKEEWINHFIYQGYYNVWVSQRKLKVVR